MTLLAGVDAGGTSTRAAVTGPTGILGRATGPGSVVRPGRALASAAVIAGVVRDALSRVQSRRCDVLAVGAAGVGRTEEREELRWALQAEGVANRVVVVTDVELALAALDSPSGIVLVGGTGSIVVGRTPDGQFLRMGGYGWQMGDEGSAYAIGRSALQAVGRAEDGRGPPTSLLTHLLGCTRLASFSDLMRWSTVASPTEVAGLAPAVASAAEGGDAVAEAILAEAVRELVLLVSSLAGRIGAPTELPVGIVGGLLAEGRPLRAAVLAGLRGVPGVAPVARALDPTAGALRIAGEVAERGTPQ